MDASPQSRGLPPVRSIADLARLAGVSVSTVSRALTGKGTLNQSTRDRIRALADAHGFRLNVAAQNLRLGRTGAIGVLLPDLYGEFFSEVIRGIDLAARREKYQVLVSSSRANAETIVALDDIVRAGKARYIGASSMASWQFMKMLGLQERLGLAKFVSMQNHYNLIYREEEREMLPLCRAEGIGVTPWSPLARGLLAGSRKAQTHRAGTDAYMTQLYDHHAEEESIIDAVAKVAAGRGVPPAQVAIAWVASRPGITAPIIGASKPHHLTDALSGIELQLSAEEIAILETPYRPRPVAGHE